MEPQAHAARHGTVMRATDTRRSMRASNRGWLLLLPALAMLVMAARAQEFVEGAVTTVAGNDAAFAYSIDGVGTEASFAVPTVRSVPLTRLLATLVSANLRGGELRSHWADESWRVSRHGNTDRDVCLDVSDTAHTGWRHSGGGEATTSDDKQSVTAPSVPLTSLRAPYHPQRPRTPLVPLRRSHQVHRRRRQLASR
jgi:hypothetical protein